MVSHALVTGATGWVGERLCQALLARDIRVSAMYRGHAPAQPGTPQRSQRAIEWIDARDGSQWLADRWPAAIDTVFHLAARVHQRHESGAQAEAAYHATNCDFTLALAEAARAHGATRFIFASSVKALGDVEPGRPWRENDAAAPTDAYGRSKQAAERGLRALENAQFAVTILRFPLIYGRGVKANFAQLVAAVRNGWPLPLALARAPRSLLGLANALDALIHCAQHVDARHQTFHVADRETPSVSELISALGDALGRPARLVKVPLPVLKLGARMAGQSDLLMRLIEPLRLDTRHLTETLGWRAPYSLIEGLAQTVQGEPR